MKRRRLLLMTVVATLAVGNAIFLAARAQRSSANAHVSHVGIGSFSMVFLRPRKGTTFSQGHWSPALKDALVEMEDMDRSTYQAVLVSLGPKPTYGQLLAAIHDLKARKLCYMLVNEIADRQWLSQAAPSILPDDLETPGLVLCGASVGDTGFFGTLPPDGPLNEEE